MAAITAGAYSHVYGTLQEIGRGAFGSVMTGFRREDGKMVSAYNAVQSGASSLSQGFEDNVLGSSSG